MLGSQPSCMAMPGFLPWCQEVELVHSHLQRSYCYPLCDLPSPIHILVNYTLVKLKEKKKQIKMGKREKKTHAFKLVLYNITKGKKKKNKTNQCKFETESPDLTTTYH